jgi:hypothetical protein
MCILIFVSCGSGQGNDILPFITFSFIPAYGSFDDLVGRVAGVTTTQYKVAVYIFVWGWYNKPTWGSPATAIQPNGTWVTDITTGGNDELATKIAAFLIPDTYNPPLMNGEANLPQALYNNAVTHVEAERQPPADFTFSGYDWIIKQSNTPVGPGPNRFSDDSEDVWVDAQGGLHLKIVKKGDDWYCTEVYTTASLGYGTYRFVLESAIDQIDRNVVLGLFTWDDEAPENHYREMDIEFSQWGEVLNENTQYVVQPWETPENLHRFDTLLQGIFSTHLFLWTAEAVTFTSYQGRLPDVGALIRTWTYEGADVPPAGDAHARINLWLNNGTSPSDGQPVEVVIVSFEFIPE